MARFFLMRSLKHGISKSIFLIYIDDQSVILNGSELRIAQRAKNEYDQNNKA